MTDERIEAIMAEFLPPEIPWRHFDRDDVMDFVRVPPTDAELDAWDKLGPANSPARRLIREVRRLRGVCDLEAHNVRDLRHPHPSPAALDYWTQQIANRLRAAAEGRV